MFYSHEVLTSRKYGVATIWLVATLGSKSGLRKVGRKAILDVNIPKACDTVLEPKVPMALRLQSNLMYGISKVYLQQCQYILADAQTAQTNLKSLFKISQSAQLDPNAGKARLDQLVMQDDPGFVADTFLPIFDFDASELDVLQVPLLQYTSQSSLPTSTSPSISGVDGLDIQLQIPTSESGNVGEFEIVSSVSKISNPNRHVSQIQDDNNLQGFDPNVGFEFDEEGNIFGLDPEFQAVGLRQESGAGDAPVFEELGDLRQDQTPDTGGDLLGGNLETVNTESQRGQPLPDAEAFPEQTRSQINEAPRHPSETRVAGNARRQRPRRQLKTDHQQQIRNADLAHWNQNYLLYMETARQQKAEHMRGRHSKAYAHQLVFGVGMNSIGALKPDLRERHPLSVFTGAKLQELLGPRPQKRQRHQSGSVHDADQDSRKEHPASMSPDPARVAQDLPLMPDTDFLPSEDDVEIARVASAQLEDHSTQMPWNIPVSNRGSRQGSRQSSLFHTPKGPRGSLGTSGLHVRGSRQSTQLDLSSPLRARESVYMAGRSSSIKLVAERGVESSLSGFDDNALLGSGDEDTFELHGIAADPDARKSATSQWTKGSLPVESLNFLDFVKTLAHPQDALEVGVTGVIAFETLLPVQEHTRTVAAQAFMHLLTLSSSSLLKPEQDGPFENIIVMILG